MKQISNQLCLFTQSNKTGSFEGPAFFSQLEQFEKFSESFDWLEKKRPSKLPLLF